MESDIAEPKLLRWVASSKDDISELPRDVKAQFGQALWEIQCGDTPRNTKAMRGRLRDVREVVVEDDSETYRSMYTTALGNYVYVLDAVHKKSKTGIATSSMDLDRIERRLRVARKHYAQNK